MKLLLQRALIDGTLAENVSVTITDGRFSAVEVGAEPTGAEPTGNLVVGLTIPGQANCHSHAFHRALRGRTQAERGTFWTWREQMYGVAARLTPDSYFALARATYREMVAAGVTAVGEFHYLHHGPDGTPYDDPNAMGSALIAAAQEAGLRITLLDTCYLASGFGEAPAGVQVRYSDGDAERWASRVDALASSADSDTVLVGAAIHSVRAVPADQISTVAGWAEHRPLHAHVSEQPAENRACLAATGLTPTELLHRHGALGSMTSAVHATHLTEHDISLLGRAKSFACFCPTTERDLADGVGPSRALHEAGARLTLGSDSHAIIDPYEEMRAMELDERLITRERGHWSVPELLNAGGPDGHASLGFADAGRIAVGQRADLVTLDDQSPRTAGTGLDGVVFAATPADVRQVVVDGRIVFTEDDRTQIGHELADAIAAVHQ